MGGRGMRLGHTKGPRYADAYEIDTALENSGYFGEFVSLIDPDNGTSYADFDCAKSILRAVENMMEKFPESNGMIDSMYFAPELRGSGTYGEEMFFSRTIRLNPEYFENYDRMKRSLKWDVDVGFHPPGTEDPSSVVVHEIAHGIDGYLTYYKGIDNGGETFASDLIQQRAFARTGQTKRSIKSRVSEYAAKNTKEWFAESIAEYVCSPNPRQEAIVVGEELKKLLSEVM